MQMQFYFAIVGLPMRNRENKRYLVIVLLRKLLYCTRQQFAFFLQRTVAAVPSPFCERSLAFLRVDTTIDNRAFSHERCNINLVPRGPLVERAPGLVWSTPRQNALRMSAKFNIRSAFYFRSSI